MSANPIILAAYLISKALAGHEDHASETKCIDTKIFASTPN
jgi:hypothetical protein